MSEDKQIVYDTIERFLSGNLTGEALVQFKERLNQDADLAAQVEFHRQLQSAVTSEPDELNFRKLLKQEGQKYTQSRGEATLKKGRFGKIWFAAAASILLLLGAWLMRDVLLGQNNSSEALFAQYFEQPVLLIQDRSTTSSLDKQKAIAYQAYENKNFHRSAELLNQILGSNTGKMEMYYFAAVSNLSIENGHEEKAIEQLDRIIQDGQSSYVYGARWYKALALLKKGNKEAAVDELSFLKGKGQGKYKKMAIELLGKM